MRKQTGLVTRGRSPNPRSQATTPTTPRPPGAEDENTPLLETVRNGIQHTRSTFAPPDIDSDDPQWKRFFKETWRITWGTLTSSPVNFLLVLVPVGIVAGALGWDAKAVFILNFFAIVPLAALLSFATEELAVKCGETIGGLMNATFGNAVELIVSIVALKEGQIRIVQAGMLGSILSNILLVLGCCFLAGGWHGGEQEFNGTVASTMSSLMLVASTSLVIPATLYAALSSSDRSSTEAGILQLSRGTSIILLLLYILYLFFQLKSHAYLFDVEHNAENNTSESTAATAVDEDDENDEPEEPHLLQPIPAGIALLLVTVCVAVCAEYLVDSIEDVVAATHMSKTFIGLILLPIVGNAAEHVTACIVATKGKMDLAIGVAVGSSLQIAIFVTPFLVILGWIIGKPMTLHFSGVETIVFFLSVLVVNYLIQDGKSNYLEGAMCLGTYLIIAIAFYVYPEDAKEDLGGLLKGLFSIGS